MIHRVLGRAQGCGEVVISACDQDAKMGVLRHRFPEVLGHVEVSGPAEPATLAALMLPIPRAAIIVGRQILQVGGEFELRPGRSR